MAKEAEEKKGEKGEKREKGEKCEKREKGEKGGNARNADNGDPVAQLEVGKAYLDGRGTHALAPRGAHALVVPSSPRPDPPLCRMHRRACGRVGRRGDGRGGWPEVADRRVGAGRRRGQGATRGAGRAEHRLSRRGATPPRCWWLAVDRRCRVAGPHKAPARV